MAESFSLLHGETHLCNCIGPQNGQPRCPCAMRGVVQRNGRWIVPERDLGPVTRTRNIDLNWPKNG